MRTVFNIAAVLVAAVIWVAPVRGQGVDSLKIPARETERDAGSRVSEVFDRFKGGTLVTGTLLRVPTVMKPEGWQGEVSLAVMYQYPGQNPTPPAAVNLYLLSSSSDWQYLRCHDVDALVDGVPLPLPPSTHSGNVRSGGVSEQISVPVPVREFLTIANATKVELRLCRAEMVIEGSALAVIREAASRMKAPVSPPAPTPATAAGLYTGRGRTSR